MELKDLIHKDFYNEKRTPVLCETVGEVIEQLKRLPEDLAIGQGFGEAVILTVYNISMENPHLSFDEID